jgi:hypothetical protein
MKKIIFYLSAIISAILLINIINIIIDFKRLTNWGFGYLVGKIILLLLFLLISYFTRKFRFGNNPKTN